jgi:hypothetical protein
MLHLYSRTNQAVLISENTNESDIVLTVLHVLVLVDVVEVLEDSVPVVLSSRHPHQPGVLQVSVRVRVEVVVGAVVVVVDGLVCVPFSNFQR